MMYANLLLQYSYRVKLKLHVLVKNLTASCNEKLTEPSVHDFLNYSLSGHAIFSADEL